MVVAYLEKIRKQYLEEKVEVNARLKEIEKQKKENSEFIRRLENKNTPEYEEFSPRTINEFHKVKIVKLLEEQQVLEDETAELQSRLENLEKELSEVEKVIRVAKRKRM